MGASHKSACIKKEKEVYYLKVCVTHQKDIETCFSVFLSQEGLQ